MRNLIYGGKQPPFCLLIVFFIIHDSDLEYNRFLRKFPHRLITDYNNRRICRQRVISRLVRKPRDLKRTGTLSVFIICAGHSLSYDILLFKSQSIPIQQAYLSIQKRLLGHRLIQRVIQRPEICFPDPHQNGAEILRMLLIFLPLILIRNIHPCLIELAHPPIREIRFPGHGNLRVNHRINRRYPFDLIQSVKKRAVKNLYMIFHIRFFDGVVFQHHI